MNVGIVEIFIPPIPENTVGYFWKYFEFHLSLSNNIL